MPFLRKQNQMKQRMKPSEFFSKVQHKITYNSKNNYTNFCMKRAFKLLAENGDIEKFLFSLENNVYDSLYKEK